jgi:hypothetical protein
MPKGSLLFALLALLVGPTMFGWSQEPAAQPAPAAPQTAEEKPKPEPIIVPAGTVLTVKLTQGITSKTAKAGDTFNATLSKSVKVGGNVALPAGSKVTGSIVEAKAKGKIKGEGELALKLTKISVKGKSYTIQTQEFSQTEKGKGKRTAATTGGGAAGGALIGGLAGGGKGAAIGAGVGAGVGLAGGAMTGNKQVELPAEAAVGFTMSAPLKLPPPEQ